MRTTLVKHPLPDRFNLLTTLGELQRTHDEGQFHTRNIPKQCNELSNFLQQQDTPQAHRGFLRRARAVDIHSLYRHASEQGLRLVLCGKG